MLLDRPLTLLSQLLLLLVLTSDCYGRRSGAPDDACTDLTPQHPGSSPQPETDFPYMLKATPTSVQPGGRVSLAISPKTSDTEPIEGFFVQARNAQNPKSSSALGQFVQIGSHKAVDCGGSATGITHSNNEKKQTVSVTWEAPDDLDGDVVFLVSVVQKFDTFWAGVPSETVMLAKEPTAEPEPTSEPEPEPESEPNGDDDDDDDDDKSSATLVRAGAALLLAPLAMAMLHRLQ